MGGGEKERRQLHSEGTRLRPLRCLGNEEVLGPETEVQPAGRVDIQASARGLSGTRARECLRTLPVLETKADARTRAARGPPSSAEEGNGRRRGQYVL